MRVRVWRDPDRRPAGRDHQGSDTRESPAVIDLASVGVRVDKPTGFTCPADARLEVVDEAHRLVAAYAELMVFPGRPEQPIHITCDRHAEEPPSARCRAEDGSAEMLVAAKKGALTPVSETPASRA
jgi:hypothetical protein